MRFSKFIHQLPLYPRCVWKIHWRGMTQSIWNFFWRQGWFVGTNYLGVTNSRTRKLSVNNYLLKQWCNNHHHRVTLLARISLTLSRHPSLSFIAPRKVFRATSCIATELLCMGFSWSSNICSSMSRGPQEYITYEFVLTSPAVFRVTGSSNLDSFCDGWLVAVQLLFCRVLLPGLVQCGLQHSCVIAVKLFLQMFC